MTNPTDPIEDESLIRDLITGLAEHGIEAIGGALPGTLNLKVGADWVQFLRLEVSGSIQLDPLAHPVTKALILPADAVRRSRTKKKLSEVIRILRYRRLILEKGWPTVTPK